MSLHVDRRDTTISSTPMCDFQFLLYTPEHFLCHHLLSISPIPTATPPPPSWWLQLIKSQICFQIVLGISESIDAELSATLDELHGVKAQLEVERQHNYSAQLEKRNLATELSSYKAAAEDESRRAARALAEAQEDAGRARTELAELARKHEAADKSSSGDEFEKRVAGMSEELLKKQVRTSNFIPTLVPPVVNFSDPMQIHIQT